jgi:hypothetical protein
MMEWKNAVHPVLFLTFQKEHRENRMENGEWRMEEGEWRKEKGEWRMEKAEGRRRKAGGRKLEGGKGLCRWILAWGRKNGF